MADTAEMRRLMLHAADLLAKQEHGVRDAFVDQHAHGACQSATYTPEFVLDPMADWSAASALAQSVLRMVAAAVADGPEEGDRGADR